MINFDTLTNITYTTYKNLGKASRLGFDLNVNYQFNKRFRLSLNGNVAQFWISGLTNGNLIRNDMFTYYFSNSANYTGKSGWQFNCGLDFLSKNPVDLQNYTNAVINSNFSISKNLLDNKLSLSAFINNPFKKYRKNILTTFDKDFIQYEDTYNYYRRTEFTLNYKFGKKDVKVLKSKHQIKNDDLSN